jgi:hypothetical protein
MLWVSPKHHLHSPTHSSCGLFYHNIWIWMLTTPRLLSFLLTIGDLCSFFEWKLDQTPGNNRRKLRGTKEQSSLKTYWKNFQQVYTREAKKDMDGQIIRQMLRVPTILFAPSRLGIRGWMLICRLGAPTGSRGAWTKLIRQSARAGQFF